MLRLSSSGLPITSARLLGQPVIVLSNVTEYGWPLPNPMIPASCQPPKTLSATPESCEFPAVSERQIVRVIGGGHVVCDEIGVAPVEVRAKAVHRRGNAEWLLAQRVRVLILELERKPGGKAFARAELKLIRDRIPAGLAVRDRAERLVWPAGLNRSRRRDRIVDIDIPVEVRALVPHVRSAQAVFRKTSPSTREVPLL